MEYSTLEDEQKAYAHLFVGYNILSNLKTVDPWVAKDYRTKAEKYRKLLEVVTDEINTTHNKG
jgi:hypothetical protein